MLRPENVFETKVKGLGVVSAEDYQKDWDMEILRCIGGVVWIVYRAPLHIELSYLLFSKVVSHFSEN